MSRVKNMARAVRDVFLKHGYFKPGFIVVYSSAPDYNKIGYFGDFATNAQARQALEIGLEMIKKAEQEEIENELKGKPNKTESLDDEPTNGKPINTPGGNVGDKGNNMKKI